MKIWRELLADFRAPLERDPAVGHWLEVVFAYSGVHAVMAYRFIHRLDRAGMPVVPRVLSSLVRRYTGVEIHPSARLGAGLFIDHGMGVVIGSTTVVGENCTIYQGVTLGGTSLAREKRHPTLADDVVVGVGAAVLGDIFVGKGARIGAGAVVVKNVEPGSVMVGIPARAVTETPPVEGAPHVVTMGDPYQVRLRELEERVAALSEMMLDAKPARRNGK